MTTRVRRRCGVHMARAQLLAARVGGLAVAILMTPAVVQAADAAGREPYAVGIEHTILAEELVGREARRLELRLKLTNEDVRGLFDLRLRLVETGDASSSLSCSRKPARLRVLPSGAAKQVTADFVCTGWPPSWAGTMKDLEFEIEAVDLSTQEIVTFARTSHGEH